MCPKQPQAFPYTHKTIFYHPVPISAISDALRQCAHACAPAKQPHFSDARVSAHQLTDCEWVALCLLPSK